jgi:hypothetical protein
MGRLGIIFPFPPFLLFLLHLLYLLHSSSLSPRTSVMATLLREALAVIGHGLLPYNILLVHYELGV